MKSKIGRLSTFGKNYNVEANSFEKSNLWDISFLKVGKKKSAIIVTKLGDHVKESWHEE
jgi:hypothetical protein